MSTLPRNVKVNLTSGTHPGPEGCTATIQVGGQTLTCQKAHDASDDDGTRHQNWFHGISWDSTTPGATPHRDPEPSFEPVALPAGAWGVMLGQEVVAYFAKVGGHPDPQGAAEAEAARLKAGVGGATPNGAYVEMWEGWRQLHRERDVVKDALRRLHSAVGVFLHGPQCDNETCADLGMCGRCAGMLEDEWERTFRGEDDA